MFDMATNYMAKSRQKMRANGFTFLQFPLAVETKALLDQIAGVRNRKQNEVAAELLSSAIKEYIEKHGLPVESQMDLPIAV